MQPFFLPTQKKYLANINMRLIFVPQLTAKQMTNFILKFGKYKGLQFSATPENYQEWLLKQDWFKAPVQLDSLTIAQKQFSDASKGVKGWNGYSKKGQSAYDSMFEAEKAMDNAIFNSQDEHSPFWDGVYSWER